MPPSAESTARGLAVAALDRFRRSGERPGAIIARLAAGAGLSPADRRLLSGLVFGVIRHRRLLDHLVDRFLEKPGRLPAAARDILRLGALQIQFLDRIPVRAAVHTSVELAKAPRSPGVAPLVNAVLRRMERGPLPASAQVDAAVLHSFPDWMARRWEKALGREEARALMAAMNEHPPLHLRTNPLKAGREEARRALAVEGFPCLPGRWSPLGLVSQSDAPIDGLAAFHDGLFSVQDEAFQVIGSLLPLGPGDAALDAFAGMGGKGIHLAQRAAGRATIVATDADPAKLASLAAEAWRLGAEGITAAADDALRPPFRGASFDAVLLDVPCSGTGVIRRHPDIKWRREPRDIPRFAARQKRFLAAAAPLVRRGGYLLYATCSLEREEDEEAVLDFLGNSDTFHVVDLTDAPEAAGLTTAEGFLRTYPHRHGTDGSFAALLRRD